MFKKHTQVNMPGGSCGTTENKRVCQFSGFKVATVVQEIYEWSLSNTREFVKHLTEKQNCYFLADCFTWELIGYEKWSLCESVDCTKTVDSVLQAL